MDIVLTYVDGNDPLWQQDYAAATGKAEVLAKRYRDWGTLPYLFRGIEQHMPFIENVFLVLASPSQIPSFISDKVRIVLHKDIIPSEFLPVFNSTAIEMYLHRIEGLSEEFIYFNDDIFPVRDVRAEDFFFEGKASGHFSTHILACNLFKKQVRNSDRLARRAAGLQSTLRFIRPQHICSCMLRSACEELMSKEEIAIRESLSPLREEKNLNQYLYLDYQYFTKRMRDKAISKKHFSLSLKSTSDVASFLERPSRDFICVNDVSMSEERFQREKAVLLAAFEKHFPKKSRFEK